MMSLVFIVDYVSFSASLVLLMGSFPHSSIQSLVLSAYKAHRVKVVVVSCHSCNRHIMQGFITLFPVHIIHCSILQEALLEE